MFDGDKRHLERMAPKLKRVLVADPQPASARRNLETLLAATLEASCLDEERLGDDVEGFAAAEAGLPVHEPATGAVHAPHHVPGQTSDIWQ